MCRVEREKKQERRAALALRQEEEAAVARAAGIVRGSVNSGSLEMERRRMDRTLKRQTKELEALMSYEVKRAHLQEKQEAKVAKRAAKEKKMAQQVELNKKLMSQRRREWDLQKKQKEVHRKEF